VGTLVKALPSLLVDPPVAVPSQFDSWPLSLRQRMSS
jgi:hypothetical protein